jgi:hypothetical protein
MMVIDKATEQAVAHGREAWQRIKSDGTWEDWVLVGQALEIGRAEAMRRSGSNQPRGRGYNEAFSAWLSKNSFAKIDKGTRSRLADCMEHRAEIEQFRANLELGERLRLNHPNSVWRHWQASHKIKEPPARKKPAAERGIGAMARARTHPGEAELPCPLSDREIADWERKLGTPTSRHPDVRLERQKQLRALVIEYFERASQHLKLQAWLEEHKGIRVDQVLPKIASALEADREHLRELPGSVTAALRVRYGNYDLALLALDALPFMLRDMATTWGKPHSGQPKLEIEAYVVGRLKECVERFIGEKLPSERSEKRKPEFEFLRLLTMRLLPELTDAQFRTALRHCRARRQAAKS